MREDNMKRAMSDVTHRLAAAVVMYRVLVNSCTCLA